MDDDKLWKAVGTGVALVAGVAAKPLIAKLWARWRGTEPPGNPALPDIKWREAVLWSVMSGAALGLARLVAQRGAAEVWRKRRGDYPSALRQTRA